MHQGAEQQGRGAVHSLLMLNYLHPTRDLCLVPTGVASGEREAHQGGTRRQQVLAQALMSQPPSWEP